LLKDVEKFKKSSALNMDKFYKKCGKMAEKMSKEEILNKINLLTEEYLICHAGVMALAEALPKEESKAIEKVVNIGDDSYCYWEEAM
jgi:threonine synthase